MDQNQKAFYLSQVDLGVLKIECKYSEEMLLGL